MDDADGDHLFEGLHRSRNVRFSRRPSREMVSDKVLSFTSIFKQMEYEILVRRRGETDYAAYCPQLDIMVTGKSHEDVENRLKEIIEEHKKKEGEKTSS